MHHDSHQIKILGLGVALIVATVLALVSLHYEDSADGRTLRVREEPVVIVDTAPALRAESKPVSSLTASNRTPIQDRR